MLTIFDPIRNISFLSVFVRMMIAMLCSGFIGIERAAKRRPAGLRTHILICIGACITTTTSVYLVEVLGLYTDIARLGAQVIAGVGFIGTGAIVVTRSRQVKGLTTAAGMWAVAIVGLAIGAGFYEGGIITTILVFISEFVFGALADHVSSAGEEVSLIYDYETPEDLPQLTAQIEGRKHKILTIYTGKNADGKTYALYSLRMQRGTKREELYEDLSAIYGKERMRIL